MGRLTATASLLMYLGMVAPSPAGEFSYGLGYLATHSDNITRVPTGERDDWIHSLLAGFAYQERSVDLVARVLAQAEYNNYQDNTYGDENLYYVSSSAVWTLSPQRLFWTVEDTARQALIDSTAVETPENRVGVNVFSTGPDFSIRFSPVQTLALGARLGDVYTGRANADSRRLNGTAGWLYQASSVSTYSLNYQALDVDYDDSVANDDFLRQDLFVRAQYRPSRSQYTIDLGTSDISRDRGNDVNGALTRFIWDRQLTPESSFGMSASREFSDTGTDLLTASQALNAPTMTAEQSAQSIASTTDTLTSDVYMAKRGEIFYNRRSSSTGLHILANHRTLDYETLALDRKENYARMEFDYFYSGSTTVSLFSEYTKTDYSSFVRQDTDRNSGIRFSSRLTRTFSLGLEGRRIERASTDPTLEYVDNRVLLSVLYSSGQLFTPIPGR
ncbi:MAG: hypothetical protein Tsb0026_05070 [Sulfuricaulis sp.]